MIRILIADDHPLMRAGIRAIIEQDSQFIVSGEAASGFEALSLCQAGPPDVLLLDLEMPGPPPAVLIAEVRQSAPEVRVIILTAHDEEIYVRNLVALGVAGYILKDEAPEALRAAITTALNGGVWLSQSVANRLSAPTPATLLTSRELEVLLCVAKGLNNQQTAAQLSMAEGTLKNHLVSIYDRLEVRTRAEAVAWAWEHFRLDLQS